MEIAIINHSNHPSAKWSTEQVEALISIAREGVDASIPHRLIDVPFPLVDPRDDEAAVLRMAEAFIQDWGNHYPPVVAVHLMGETSYLVALTRLLRENSIPVYCSTTAREVVEHEDGRKESVFRFVRMRQIG